MQGLAGLLDSRELKAVLLDLMRDGAKRLLHHPDHRPTGSGKTTTLYAGLAALNDSTRNISWKSPEDLKTWGRFFRGFVSLLEIRE